MPALTAYTQYETLAFCQSIVRHGADPTAFEGIAADLNANQLVRENPAYDESRLTPNALQNLYSNLLKFEEETEVPTVNGDGATDGTNPRKRKLSQSSLVNGESESANEDLVYGLVDKLYTRFKEEVIREIRKDEEDYAKLQIEIKELENQVKDRKAEREQNVPTSSDSATDQPQTSQAGPGKPAPSAAVTNTANSLQAEAAGTRQDLARSTSPASIGKPAKSPAPGRIGSPYPPVLPSQHSPVAATPTLNTGRSSTEPNRQSQSGTQHTSPGAFHRTLPPPSPQRPNYGPVPPQHGYMPGPQGHPVPMMHPVHGVPQMPPPMEYANQKRAPSTSTPNRGSPVPMQHQQQYLGYPPYQQPPWPHQIPPQHPYGPPQPYPNAPFYIQSPGGRHGPHFQTPHQSPYQGYVQTAPMSYPGHPSHGWHPAMGHPYYSHHPSPQATPVPSVQARRPPRPSGSSTPWKKKAVTPSGLRPPSPTRPDREVSPLSDTEQPDVDETKRDYSPQGEVQASKHEDSKDASTKLKSSRQGRTASTTPPVALRSRSRSVTSRHSESMPEKPDAFRRSRKIKAETPSTPLPNAPDAEPGQRSSGRKGRSLNDQGTPLPDLGRTATVSKRKRSFVPGSSPTPPPISPSRTVSHHRTTLQDAGLVIVSRSFSKTAQLLLNEITSHKLAGIFAKPLNERDAPGYKDLVLRPQDLKSIKAAVSKGNRAAIAAIETLEIDKEGEDEINTTSKSKNGVTEGPIAGGMFLVKRNDELVPPRGIVNSSQLETELIRMFANAVMFNPLPSSERGWGRNLRIRKNGGDVDAMDDGEAETSDDGSSTEEGGIISDAREMFEDVVEQLAKWRELETERMNTSSGGGEPGGQGSGHGNRHGSGSISISIRQSSVSSALNEDDGAGEVDEGVAPSRKRRKLVAE